MSVFSSHELWEQWESNSTNSAVKLALCWSQAQEPQFIDEKRMDTLSFLYIDFSVWPTASRGRLKLAADAWTSHWVQRLLNFILTSLIEWLDDFIIMHNLADPLSNVWYWCLGDYGHLNTGSSVCLVWSHRLDLCNSVARINWYRWLSFTNWVICRFLMESNPGS